jgi:hypothetical protein
MVQVDWIIVNNKLERTLKKAVMANFKVVLRHLSGGTEEMNKKPARLAGVLAEVRFCHLPNTSHIHSRFSKLTRSKFTETTPWHIS